MLFLLGWCCTWLQRASAQERLGKKYALTMSVEIYDPQVFNRLSYAGSDAEELGQALKIPASKSSR